MRKIEKLFLFCSYLLSILVFNTKHIFAYIDPSAVTYTAQALAALVIAIGSSITVFRHKIVNLFKKRTIKKREIHVYEDIMKD